METLALAGFELVGGRPIYGEWSERWGRNVTAELIERYDFPEDVNAILCGSDQIARGALDALRNVGIAVPQDHSVSEEPRDHPVPGSPLLR